MDEVKTPSMDDKDVPSPPVRTTDQYEVDCAAGITRVGKPLDAKGTTDKAKEDKENE
jgi:hypothetical protein